MADFNPYNKPTPRGYNMGEVTSALQKAIRRGDEELALFWALELVDAGFWRHMWKRLRVIASEDIGSAWPGAAILTDALANSYESIATKSKSTHNLIMVSHVILALCRSPKNRETDHFILYINNRRNAGWKPEYPLSSGRQ